MTLQEYEQLITPPPEWVPLSKLHLNVGDCFRFINNTWDLFVVLENRKFRVKRGTTPGHILWNLDDFSGESAKKVSL